MYIYLHRVSISRISMFFQCARVHQVYIYMHMHTYVYIHRMARRRYVRQILLYVSSVLSLGISPTNSERSIIKSPKWGESYRV